MAAFPPILVGQETYLGDGLYASFDVGSVQFKLRAPRYGERDAEVYLEPAVLDAFQAFVRLVHAALEPSGEVGR